MSKRSPLAWPLRIWGRGAGNATWLGRQGQDLGGLGRAGKGRRIRRTLALFGTVSALALSALGLARPAGAQAVAYTTSMPDVEDSTLNEALHGSSTLLSLQDDPPPGVPGLARRAMVDTDRLRAVLRSFGFYDGTVEIRIAGMAPDDPALIETLGEPAEGAAPVPVQVAIDPGPRYTIGRIEIHGPEAGAALPAEINRDEIGLAPGDPARAAAVLSTQDRVIAQLRNAGYPFAHLADREAVVDHATRTMDLTLAFEPGPYATLGTVTFEGSEGVDQAFLAQRVPFEPGEPYSPAQIDALRNDLSGLGVFSSVRVDPADALDENGRLPVTVTLADRAPRFVGFGASYASTEGAGVRAYWGHRNLFGAAERLRIDASVSRLAQNDPQNYEYRLELSFRKPDLWLRHQDLLVDLAALRERPDAYQSESLTGTVGIERRLTDHITVGAGVSASQERVTANDETVNVTLIGVPLSFRYDGTNNLLDPTEGFRVNAAVTPFPTIFGSSQDLLISRVGASAYYDFGTDGEVVLAGRAAVGSILLTNNTSDVPATRRFYAGGGGSVRGYGYQNIGPLASNGDPMGGRALFETGLEVRYRFSESFGIVPFVDAGSVYDRSFPDFSSDLRIGAGIGVRYYTPFGPIRADVALPLQRRDGDPLVGIYVSIGQAF